MKHALSIDVEDWFQVLNMAHVVDRASWESHELRCGDSTRRFLDLLDSHGAKATFFFLGWIAERLPDLVQDVASAGHEVGSHGYDHRLLTDLGEEGFKADIAKSGAILRDITGVAPRAFRACTWSITRRTPWALPALAEAGFTLDSSIYPIRHPDYGVRGAPASPYRIRTPQGTLTEFPPLTLSVLGRRFPVGGGGYLRLFPSRLLRMGLRQQESQGWPGCLYLHPWELDPEQPRQDLGGLRGFRHYVNLRRTATKLSGLLKAHQFVGLSQALAEVEERLAATDPVEGALAL